MLERFPSEYINSMVVDDATNRLYVATSGKRLVVYDTETQEKICQVENAHGKGIYKVRLAPEGQEASLLTCSADNKIKTWKLDEEAKTLNELQTISQADAEENLNK